MIVGYHIVFGAYGFWLPNDPRGSWSDFVGSWELFRFGKATKTNERRSVANLPHDHEKRLSAKMALKYPEIHFTGIQARAIGLGFGDYVDKTNLPIWSCAILPEHVHLIVGRFRLTVEQLVIQLKGAATERLKEQGIHPLSEFASGSGNVPKCFARGEWKVFLDEEDLEQAIEYVEQNPIKEGKPRQHWKFVKPVEWMNSRIDPFFPRSAPPTPRRG